MIKAETSKKKLQERTVVDLIVGSLFDVTQMPAKLLEWILFSMNWPRPFS